MKRPKLKKASKRVSCGKRYKIEKKVRDHNKKLRREAKKKGVKTRPKKDPGVPHSAPFREEVLREAEQRRLQIEAENEKKRLNKIEERAKKRKGDTDAKSKEAEPKSKKSRKDNKNLRKERALNRNTKPYLCAELSKVIDKSDVVIEVLDARDPMGYRCPQLEEAVLQREGNKKLLLMLNKIDLVPKENVEKWMQCLGKEFPVVIFKASMQMQDKTVKAKKRRLAASNELLNLGRAAVCFGSSTLTELLTNYTTNTQREAALRVGVVGFPNVGKSSVINSLKGAGVCPVGPTRGITKSMQEISITKTLKLIDSPGIIVSQSNPTTSTALRRLEDEGNESVIEDVTTLINQCDKTQIILQYTVPDYRTPLEFLTLFAKKRGFMSKGGVPDTQRAASTFLSHWTGAKLSYHSKVPEDSPFPSYLSDTVVTEMQKNWDLIKLKEGNEQVLKGIKLRPSTRSLSFTSNGPTAGLLTMTEIPVKTPAPAAAAATEESVEQNENKPEQPVQNSRETEEPEMQQKTPLQESKNHVQVQSLPVDISLTTAVTDDAYDFNTDFK